MNYTDKEIKDMTKNILDYMKEETVEHFRKDPRSGKVVKYEVPLSGRMKKQISYIAESFQSLRSDGKYHNQTIGSVATKPANH